MKNIEFTEKYGYCYNNISHSFDVIKPYDYQKKLLSKFENERYLAVNTSRQMGVSQMLCFHLSNWILNNKTNMNIYYLKSNNIQSNKNLLQKIKACIDYFITTTNSDLKYIINNQFEIYLSNGMGIKTITSINGIDFNKDSLSKNKAFGLIIDDAAYIKDIGDLFLNPNQYNQLIIVSGYKHKYNFFYDELFIKENKFTKLTIKWDQNPNYTQDWYESMKIIKNGDMSEFDLNDNRIINNKNNKNRIINIRLDDETLNKLSNKLIECDLSLSEYIRTLIKKDI